MFLAISLDTSKDLIYFMLSSFLLIVIVTGAFLVSMMHIDSKQINDKLFNITRLKISIIFGIGIISLVASIIICLSNIAGLESDEKLISISVMVVGIILNLLTLFMCVSFISHTYNYSVEKAERLFNKLHRGFSMDETLEKLERFQITKINNVLKIKYIYFDCFMKDTNIATITFSYNKLESIEMEDLNKTKERKRK